jgi:hypothetical protein
LPTTGTPHAIASSAARPRTRRPRQQQHDLRRRQGRLDGGHVAEERRAVLEPALARQPLGLRAQRAVADREQARRDLLRIASKIARTSGMRLTGRKFETCTTSASPSRASPRAKAEAPSGRYCRVSTKLGTTSIPCPTPNSRIVTSRR